MKVLILVFAVLFAGCSAVSYPSRSEVVSHLPEVRAVEAKQEKIKEALMILAFSGVEFSSEEEKALKEHMDLLYMYVGALYSSLVAGDIPLYNLMLSESNREINAIMEAIVVVSETHQPQTGIVH